MESQEKTQVEETKSGNGAVKPSGKQIYRELPGLLYTQVGQTMMFNADYFITVAESPKNIEDYLRERGELVKTYADAIGTTPEFMAIKNGDGPNMVHAALSLDFACWVVPALQIHVYEKTHEMFMNGFSVSNEYILESAKKLK